MASEALSRPSVGGGAAERKEGTMDGNFTIGRYGGVAEFKDRFSSAGAEFRVALSGPLISIGLGVLFVLIALADLPTAVDAVAAWLGYINLWGAETRSRCKSCHSRWTTAFVHPRD